MKIPKNETVVHWHYSEDKKELLYIITQIIGQVKFNLFKVNADSTILKIGKTQDNAIFMEIYGVVINEKN